MAKNGGAAEAAQNQVPVGPPKGFEDITIPEIDAWYNPSEGKVFTGQIVHYIEFEGTRQNEIRKVVLVKLSQPTDAAVMSGDKNKTPVQMREGQILAVSIRYRLSDLLNYVEHKGSVWVLAVDKKDIGKGQTMWNFKVAVNGKKGAPPAPTATKPGGDDIPF